MKGIDSQFLDCSLRLLPSGHCANLTRLEWFSEAVKGKKEDAASAASLNPESCKHYLAVILRVAVLPRVSVISALIALAEALTEELLILSVVAAGS